MVDTPEKLLDLSMRVAAEEGKHTWAEFMEEHGDDQYKSPETGNRVKLKSLGKSDKGKKIQQKAYRRWKLDRQRKEEAQLPKGEREKAEKKRRQESVKELQQKLRSTHPKR